MDYFSSPANLKLLQDLLKEPQAEESGSEPDDRVPNFTTKFSTPSTSTAIESVSTNQPGTSASSVTSRRFRNIDENPPQTLSEWEQQEALLNDIDLENRCTPEYRIVYKQSVTPEDIYLQMGNKTSATASCEEMCVEILLPNETVCKCIDRMELDVASHEIDLRTPNYRLKLPLVQPIDPNRSKASWDNEKKILRLTLRMKREYDFINL